MADRTRATTATEAYRDAALRHDSLPPDDLLDYHNATTLPRLMREVAGAGDTCPFCDRVVCGCVTRAEKKARAA